MKLSEGTLLWLILLSACEVFSQCEHVTRFGLLDELGPLKKQVAVQQVQIDSLKEDVARLERLESERRWATP